MLNILKRFKASEYLQIVISIAFIVIQVWLDLKLPDYMSEITTLIQTPGSEMADIWSSGAMMLICAFASLISSIIVGFFAARLATSLTHRLRGDFYKKVESFSMEEMNRFSIASLITRSTNDMNQIQSIIAMGLQVIIKAPILAIWAITKIAGKNWQWSAATAIAVVILVVIVGTLVIFALPKFQVIQNLTDNLNRIVRENLVGVRVIRAYNAEEYQENKFDVANDELTKTNLFVNQMMAIMSPGMSLIMNGLSLAIYWIGAYLINGAALPDRLNLFSDMIVYSSYAMQVIMGFMMLVMIFIMLPRAVVSANRINEVLETEVKITDGPLEEIPWDVGTVEFKNVSFKYPDAEEYVLKDVSFTASGGETIAFIGATGSGKSTLINLLTRFYDVTSGEVLIDGVNVKDYKLENLYEKFGYVSQKAVIFSGTIKSNVAFGKKVDAIDNTQLEKSLDIAKASEFVTKMDGTYDAAVGQSGSNLSGGQKQRLSIARAVYRNPEIFVFDDSFSALDYKTDKELRADLMEQSIGSTTFIVAQRIGTIRNADKIIVLEDGELVGNGKHDDLMKSCEIYQEIAYSQLSKEEL